MKGRKKDHVDIVLSGSAEGTGNDLESYRFIHDALPDISLESVDTTCTFLGKDLKAPFMISPMTGGSGYKQINRNLAIAAQEEKIALGLGSGREGIESQEWSDFDVRSLCPDIPLIANIGAVQLNYGIGLQEIKRLLLATRADALCFHLNPLQEALQIEGETDFRGLLEKMSSIRASLDVPVLVKEVGFGISAEVCLRLMDAGFTIIDVAGMGGTDFSAVESQRKGEETVFREWGMSTAESVLACGAAGRGRLVIIASGGLRSGLDAAKAIALGADIAGFAAPFLKAAIASDKEVISLIKKLKEEMQISMFCIGAKNLARLKGSKSLRRISPKTI